jgi:hypothetical protein
MPPGRPQKEWTDKRVRDMLASRPNRSIPLRELKQRVHYSRYPERWHKLCLDMAASFHTEVVVEGRTTVIRLLTQEQTNAHRVEVGLPPESSVSQ